MRKSRFRRLRPRCEAHRAAALALVKNYDRAITVCPRATPGVRPPAMLKVYRCERCDHEVLASPASVAIVQGGGSIVCLPCIPAVRAGICGAVEILIAPGSGADINAHQDTQRYINECEGKQ